MKVELIKLQIHGDKRGSLVAIEEGVNVPFHVKRIYYMFNTLEDVRRGYHAHHKTRQLAICVKGHCRFFLDDGFEQVDFLLNDSSKGLMLEPYVWHEMYDFSNDAVLVVLADDYYNELDYIRDYDEFKTIVSKMKVSGVI